MLKRISELLGLQSRASKLPPPAPSGLPARASSRGARMPGDLAAARPVLPKENHTPGASKRSSEAAGLMTQSTRKRGKAPAGPSPEAEEAVPRALEGSFVEEARASATPAARTLCPAAPSPARTADAPRQAAAAVPAAVGGGQGAAPGKAGLVSAVGASLFFSPVYALFAGSGAPAAAAARAAARAAESSREAAEAAAVAVAAAAEVPAAAAPEEEEEEEEDFDPYLFIHNLPPLASCVPLGRSPVLPRKARRAPRVTLVLDLDETLVHSSLEAQAGAPDFSFPVQFNNQLHTVNVRRRPQLEAFLERVGSLFEVIIFTASQRVYAERLLNIIDPGGRHIRHRIFRDSCVFVDGNYLKDLTVLGRDLATTVIVDNSPQAFGFQLENGIEILSWFDDPNDRELPALLPFLESLADAEDVRPLIARQFKMRDKVAAAGKRAMALG